MADGIAIAREVVESIASGQPLEQTLRLIAERVAELAGFDFCGILLPTPERRIRLAGAYNFPDRYEQLVQSIFQVPYEDEGVSGSPTSAALRERRTFVLKDARTERWYERWRPLAEEYGFRSMVSVPLISEGKLLGVLNGYSVEARDRTDGELFAVETLAGQAALALRLTLLVDVQQTTIAQLRDSNEQLERHREMLERAHEIHLRLTSAVIAGADSATVGGILARLIGRPIAIVDARGELLCAAAPGEPAAAQGSQGAAGRTSEPAGKVDREAAAPFEQALAMLGGPAAAERHAADSEARQLASEPPMLLAQIHLGAERLGYVLTPAGAAESRELDLRALEHAATVLAVDVVKGRVARATEERLCSDFLFDLLNGRDTEARLRERATHYGLALGDGHRVLVLTIDDRSPEAAEAAEAADSSHSPYKQRAVRLARDTLREHVPACLVSQLGNVVTVLVPDGASADALALARSATQASRRRIQKLAPRLRLSAGIGSLARTLFDFEVSHREAQQCLMVLQRVGREGETVAVDELGVLALFLDANWPDQLVAVGDRVLGAAVEHDRRANGSLVATLGSYLDHNCNARACAEDLFVHPNTVKYRLRRLEELCGLELANPDDLLQATIARLSLRLLPASASQRSE